MKCTILLQLLSLSALNEKYVNLQTNNPITIVRFFSFNCHLYCYFQFFFYITKQSKQRKSQQKNTTMIIKKQIKTNQKHKKTTKRFQEITFKKEKKYEFDFVKINPEKKKLYIVINKGVYMCLRFFFLLSNLI